MSRGKLTAALLGALPAWVLPALPVVAAQVDTSELARCHALDAKDARLSCYEALTEAALAASASVGPTAHDAGAPGAYAAGAPTAGASAAPAGQTAPAAGAAAAPAHPVDPNDPANFGLSRRQLEAHPSGSSGLTSIKTGVSQITEDRRHNITVVLDNGQTWVFIEPEPRLRPGDTVTIKRASLGSFLMLTPSRRSYRVERVK